MNIELRFDTTGVNWETAAMIFREAPLGEREPDTLQRAFENSDFVCFAWDGDNLVGLGRALSDGVLQSVIYDICLLPAYQGQKLGSRILRTIIDRLSTPTTILWSVPGKEGFYEKFGFAPMLTAMAKYKNPQQSAANGYIRLTPSH